MEESRIKHRGIMSAELSEFCAKATYQLQITISGGTLLQQGPKRCSLGLCSGFGAAADLKLPGAWRILNS